MTAHVEEVGVCASTSSSGPLFYLSLCPLPSLCLHFPLPFLSGFLSIWKEFPSRRSASKGPGLSVFFVMLAQSPQQLLLFLRSATAFPSFVREELALMGSQPLVISRQYDVFRVNCSSIMSAFAVPCICLRTRGYDVLYDTHNTIVSCHYFGRV